ncbi:hypothetical protein B0H14DRAFT_2886592 [Mycena olivaceomarginata]|nr:hypothetical protein B0H14DRAFT_2886592 [Mycena olivaceomarginata]
MKMQIKLETKEISPSRFKLRFINGVIDGWLVATSSLCHRFSFFPPIFSPPPSTLSSPRPFDMPLMCSLQCVKFCKFWSFKASSSAMQPFKQTPTHFSFERPHQGPISQDPCLKLFKPAPSFKIFGSSLISSTSSRRLDRRHHPNPCDAHTVCVPFSLFSFPFFSFAPVYGVCVVHVVRPACEYQALLP